MSATIHFSSDSNYGTITQALRKDEPNSTNQILLHVTKCKWLDVVSKKASLKAKMTTMDDDSVCRDVVIKLTFNDSSFLDMQSEANFYRDSLAPYYGKGVPTFYGYYEGECYSSWHEETLRCTFLVLEWCGERIKPFNMLERDFRRKLIELAVKMHREWNIDHRDLRHYNVVDKDGAPFIIDFEHSKGGHRCPPFEIDVLKSENSWFPLPTALLRKEMSGLLDDVEWWLPTTFQWRGYTRRYEYITSIEDIMHLRRSPGSVKISEERLYAGAYEIWKTVELRWEEFQPGKPGPPVTFKTYEEYAAAQRGRKM
ncbi:hypothetical protein DXG03_003923 [Asterophora parasitica]|uniref:Protein kinase domain-containing protein n=1 Tax=Asterophora parasitica TaxID=117018 RepID=A0A9P7K987_9AGAR|nr:hypothetical protein DXG03_003923 [Asterophora parasitica]